MVGVSPLERVLLLAVAAAVALAGIANGEAFAPVPRFLLATLALLGLAWVVAFSTEQVGGHLGSATTGFLQATVANLPELFVIVFALNAGELIVAQTAIVGSMLANALLLLGIVILVGSSRSEGGKMRFSQRLPNDTVTLLLVMLFAVVLASPALGLAPRSTHTRTVSVVAACCLLVVYGAWISRSLLDRSSRTTSGLARVPLPSALIMLALGGVGSAFVSEWFINALRPAIAQLHVSEAFAGLVIVAIAGNAVEHAASVVLAARGHFDLAISVVKSSVAQIAAFLYPALVIISLLLPTQLTFALEPVYIGALGLMTIIVWQVAGDGEATLFEGLALISLYVIVAVVAAAA